MGDASPSAPRRETRKFSAIRCFIGGRWTSFRRFPRASSSKGFRYGRQAGVDAQLLDQLQGKHGVRNLFRRHRQRAEKFSFLADTKLAASNSSPVELVQGNGFFVLPGHSLEREAKRTEGDFL